MWKLIQPIQTKYDGYMFRSRLEARWAVFFDAAGVEYQYEPEGYEGVAGGWYLPDFYLPDFDVFAEVKGTDKGLKEDEEKLSGVIDYGFTPISDKGLILLGNIPYKEFAVPYFDLLYYDKGVCYTHCLFDFTEYGISKASFLHGEYSDKETSKYYSFYGINNKCDYQYSSWPSLPDGVSVSEKYQVVVLNHSKLPFEKINSCYKIARQARFEHGEKPHINER